MNLISSYDALLVVGFGGPERHDEVIPFLENVLRGRNVPRERLLEVAEHYYHFGGRSPINQQNRDLVAAIEALFAAEGPPLKVYWGNRNWHPMLADTVRSMERDGVRRALAFVTSVFSSYSGCRQYREDIDRARDEVGPGAPQIDKLRVCYNHPGFIGAMADRVREALSRLPGALLLFTAHSIPESMARQSAYEAQLREASALIAGAAGAGNFRLVYQSRSGSPEQPWLGPDVGDALRELKGTGARVILVPVGFVSDHMEVIYDLDTEARAIAEAEGIEMIRAGTAGTHPSFVHMVRDLALERIEGRSGRPALGELGPRPDVCEAGCCPRPARAR